MAFSNRGNFSDNRSRSFEPRGGNRGFNRPQQTMYDAVCAKCGINCQVPFRPSANRDVFCSKCFENSNGDSGDSRGPRDSRSFSDRPMYDAVCDKCGQNCQVPFQPKSGQSVYCSNCFTGKSDDRNQKSAPRSENTVDLREVNSKLDKIISLLTPAPVIEKVKSPKKKPVVEELNAEKEEIV